MAFALTKFQAWPVPLSATSWKRAAQRAELHITALAADVDLDIGDDAGTFWTAAIANATYGVVASSALTVLQTIADAANGLTEVGTPQLLDRVQIAAAPAAGQYVLAIQDHRPNITFAAADGELTYTIVLEWSLPDANVGYTAQYG
jgi:hypothetical protein